jgi:hypothetical protein
MTSIVVCAPQDRANDNQDENPQKSSAIPAPNRDGVYGTLFLDLIFNPQIYSEPSRDNWEKYQSYNRPASQGSQTSYGRRNYGN